MRKIDVEEYVEEYAQPIESTHFYQMDNYIGVRTPSRIATQYYEFWDRNDIGWAGIHSGEITANGTIISTSSITGLNLNLNHEFPSLYFNETDQPDGNYDGMRIVMDSGVLMFRISNDSQSHYRTQMSIDEEGVNLYYKNSLKLETTTNGVDITGILNATNQVYSGTGVYASGLSNTTEEISAIDMSFNTTDNVGYIRSRDWVNDEWLSMNIQASSFSTNCNIIAKIGTSNTGKIELDITNAGSPQINFSDNGGDMAWAIGGDDTSTPGNSFKIHGASSSTTPILNALTKPHFEIETTGDVNIHNGNLAVSGTASTTELILIDTLDVLQATISYNDITESIDFIFA